MEKPRSKKDVYEAVERALRSTFPDETVELQNGGRPNYMRLRVGDDRGVPTYYRIQIVQEA